MGIFLDDITTDMLYVAQEHGQIQMVFTVCKIMKMALRDWILWETLITLKGLNIVMKDLLLIMVKLCKEGVTTKSYPSLNMPLDCNFGLWVKLPNGTWDKIKVTLLYIYPRFREK